MTTEHRVLLVNDNQNVLHLLKYALEERGIAVDCTTSVTDAMQMSMHHTYDAIILSDDMTLKERLQQAGMRIPGVLMSRCKVRVDLLVSTIRGVVHYVVA